jgi:hypothetical protein
MAVKKREVRDNETLDLSDIELDERKTLTLKKGTHVDRILFEFCSIICHRIDVLLHKQAS